MLKLDHCPPPVNWYQVVILWNDILSGRIKVDDFYAWCERHPSTGRYHVHGFNYVDGFAFRFELYEDAVLFALKWL